MKSLFPSTGRKVLSLFFMHPDKQFYFREVLKLTGTKQGTIQPLVHEWQSHTHDRK